ncbi:MAG: recombinase family protein [Caldilineales bacterium]|nr:recombinase family protein [Caldilineales bacterium]
MPHDSITLTAQPRYFVASNQNIFADMVETGGRLITEPRTNKRPRSKKAKMRYAAYLRISSEEQVGNFSIDAQKRAIETWVIARGGLLVKVYVDEAQSGRTVDRPGLLQMRREAKRRKFDAVVVHKFDRLARNRTDALAFKSLLRHDYGVKVFSVSEPSEDSDGPIGVLIEGVMESVAHWYSQNLAAEVAKGKKERGNQGLHNNRAPFGFRKNKDKVLVPDEANLPGLKLAFETYAEGKHSDAEIAQLLNETGYISTTGRPFSKDTVRDMLRNRTYLGKVKYQRYSRHTNGKRDFSAPVEWFDGQHGAVISKELFEQCQRVRDQRSTHHQATTRYNHYLLRDIAYCYKCCSNHPGEETFKSYGKMRPQGQRGGAQRYYRCRARELGYECDQKGVPVEVIDDQVVNILMNLKPPKDWRAGITNAMADLLGDQDLEERLKELKQRIQRMDVRWDNGFFTDEKEYIEQRLRLQMELEQLTPVSDQDFQLAVETLENFPAHWERLEGQEEARHDLIKLLVERAYIQDDKVVAMTLRSNYHLVLGHNVKGSTEVSIDPVYTSGSDGI